MFVFQSSVRKFFLLAGIFGSVHVFAQERYGLHEDAKIALTFGGGGFLSTTDMTGITAGLLAVLMHKNNTLQLTNNALFQSGLFSKVESINSISGGSWFAARLAYSEKYRQMVESVALAKIEGMDVAKTFITKDTILKFAEKGLQEKLTGRLFKLLIEGLQRINFRGDDDALEAVKQFVGLLAVLKNNKGDKNIQWEEAGSFILDDIQNFTLGHPVQDWAKGKNWRIIVSAVTPPKGAGLLKKGPDVIFSDFPKAKLEYTIDSNVLYFPVKFSTILGYPNAPLSVTDKYDSSDEGLLSTYNVEYDGFNLDKKKILAGKIPVLCVDYLEGESIDGINAILSDLNNFKDMPLVGPVSASSAFAGTLTLNGALSNLLGALEIDTGVYYGPKLPPKDAFVKPQKIMSDIWSTKEPSQKQVDILSDYGAHEVTDGGLTDGLGVATAVATGNNEIFAIQVLGVRSYEVYFQGNEQQQKMKAEQIPVVTIFDNLDNKTVTEIFLELDESEKDTSYLESLTFTKVETKTVHNSYFGIEKGRTVTLYVLAANVCNRFSPEKVESIPNDNPETKCCARNAKKCPSNGRKKAMTIGLDENFKDYGILVSEIVDTLTSEANRAIVDEILHVLNLDNKQNLRSHVETVHSYDNDEL